MLWLAVCLTPKGNVRQICSGGCRYPVREQGVLLDSIARRAALTQKGWMRVIFIGHGLCPQPFVCQTTPAGYPTLIATTPNTLRISVEPRNLPPSWLASDGPNPCALVCPPNLAVSQRKPRFKAFIRGYSAWRFAHTLTAAPLEVG